MSGESKIVPGPDGSDPSDAGFGTSGGIRRRTFADLSTAHLTEGLAHWLEVECKRQANGGGTCGMPSVWNLGAGFLVWIPDPSFDRQAYLDAVDPILKRILEHARLAGADYVLLDRDADTCNALPVFDW
jgi:hypothetical protein